MTVQIDTLALGPLQTNCIVLREGDACWVVDPAMWPEPLLEFLDAQSAVPKAILLTHGHGDHIGGIDELKKRFPDIKVLCPAADEAMLADADLNLSRPFGLPIVSPAADELIEPGAMLTLGDSEWKVLDTSGHTPGGVSFYCESAAAVVVGDALFAGSIGRTDFPGSDSEQLLRTIRENLMTLPDETRVFPGHGPATTIASERKNNPFF